ncbi:MAG: YaeQ family protein [Pigmentiphaga sp.]|nr:YaeQ family protein [Pigmentiphaga sp.]
MALRSTIYKADLQVADNDRRYYGSHSLILARHPSETDERLMVRLLAFALQADADERLVFTRGLSEVDEPALWRHDLTGAITLWVETGLPDDRRLLKACGRAAKVIVYAYGHTAESWWAGVSSKLARARNLTVYGLPAAATRELAALAERGMEVNVNVNDGVAWVSGASGEATVEILPWRVRDGSA